MFCRTIIEQLVDLFLQSVGKKVITRTKYFSKITEPLVKGIRLP